MATLGGTNVVEIISRATNNKGKSLHIGGQPVTIFRIASGNSPGDTAALASAQVPVIQALYGPVTHNIPITNVTGVTSVTVTLGTFGATNATLGTVDVWLFGPTPTS